MFKYVLNPVLNIMYIIRFGKFTYHISIFYNFLFSIISTIRIWYASLDRLSGIDFMIRSCKLVTRKEMSSFGVFL